MKRLGGVFSRVYMTVLIALLYLPILYIFVLLFSKGKKNLQKNF